jgi:plasmid stability protein
MRTTIDLPDGLYRQLKARAALEGRPVKALLNALLLQALTRATPDPEAPRARSAPPVISTGQALALSAPSNAGLFELLDEGL